jgi:[ribosomal protein S18]-alanine N-acetyltransferase
MHLIIMMCERIEISNFLMEDLDGIMAIERNSFTSPWSYNIFIQETVNPISVIFVARQFLDGKRNIIGYTLCWLVADELHVERIAVRNDVRQRGIATSLLKEVMKYSTKSNIARATLEVRNSNFPAIHLYEKLGFSKKGIRRDYYTNPTEDAIIMWTDIDHAKI